MEYYDPLNIFFIMAAPSCEGVYLIHSSNPRGKPIFKLGRSDDIKQRMRAYGPTWEILCCFPHDDSRDLEKFLIQRFEQELKIYANNEYFETTYSASSIMKFFVDSIRFYSPSGPGSLSKPPVAPCLEKKTPEPIPRPPPNPRRKTAAPRVRFAVKEDPPEVKKVPLKVDGLKVTTTYSLTPLHRIKIHMLNPEWPNVWKYSKTEFRMFVDTFVTQLKKKELDSKYVKEQVWGFLDCMSVKKAEMNDICDCFKTLSLKDLPQSVLKELKEN